MFTLTYNGDDGADVLAVALAALTGLAADVEHTDDDAPRTKAVVIGPVANGLVELHPFSVEEAGPDPSADPFPVAIASITSVEVY